MVKTCTSIGTNGVATHESTVTHKMMRWMMVMPASRPTEAAMAMAADPGKTNSRPATSTQPPLLNR